MVRPPDSQNPNLGGLADATGLLVERAPVTLALCAQGIQRPHKASFAPIEAHLVRVKEEGSSERYDNTKRGRDQEKPYPLGKSIASLFMQPHHALNGTAMTTDNIGECWHVYQHSYVPNLPQTQCPNSYTPVPLKT